MEDRKLPKGSSSSSTFTSELFGSRDSTSPSAGIFGSMFAPSTKVFGRESLRSEPSKRRQDSASETLNAKSGVQGIEVENQSIPNGDFKKDGSEDDSGSASRGNWWQGSLYY